MKNHQLDNQCTSGENVFPKDMLDSGGSYDVVCSLTQIDRTPLSIYSSNMYSYVRYQILDNLGLNHAYDYCSLSPVTKIPASYGSKKFTIMSYPIGSMYGLLTYIWHEFMVNVGKYSSHMDPMGAKLHNQVAWPQNLQDDFDGFDEMDEMDDALWTNG